MDAPNFVASIASTALIEEHDSLRFRYFLKRVWDDTKPINAFLCANPSKANHLLSDNTITNCNNLAVQWEWGGFYVLNLYPNYSTNPSEVQHISETTRKNSQIVSDVIAEVEMLVLACGNGHKAKLAELIPSKWNQKLFCIKKNKGDGYLHPKIIKLESFPRPIRLGPNDYPNC